jgi:hypothetical protein
VDLSLIFNGFSQYPKPKWPIHRISTEFSGQRIDAKKSFSSVFMAPSLHMPNTRSFLSEKTSLRTHGPHYTYADFCLARRQPIRTVVYPRVLNRRRAARQLLFVEDNARGLSTQLCRRRHHASEVQQLFSTRSVSDVSWGKVRSLTEWRNTIGKPGWVYIVFAPKQLLIQLLMKY